MKLYLILCLAIFTFQKDSPSLKLGLYKRYSGFGNCFLSVLKNNVIYVDFGSDYAGDTYYKGKYKEAKDTLVVTITHQDSGQKGKTYKYSPIAQFDFKFLIRSKFLVCTNCPHRVDTITFHRPIEQKER